MRTRLLLSCGAIGGPLFVLTFLVEGATRGGYDSLRHPVSSLALGDLGWTQVLNFVVTGLLMLAFAAGLRAALRPGPGATWGPSLVGAYAVGLVGAGVFPTDPVSGYPPGTAAMIQYTPYGALHDAFSIPVFIALPMSCFVLTRRFHRIGRTGWAAYSMATGIGFLVTFVLASLAFGQTEGLVEIGGLLQRVSITIGWSWLTLLAVHLLRHPGESPQAGGDR